MLVKVVYSGYVDARLGFVSLAVGLGWLLGVHGLGEPVAWLGFGFEGAGGEAGETIKFLSTTEDCNETQHNARSSHLNKFINF